jgi:cold shock CspA family protein
MNNEFKIDLDNARELKQSGKFSQALEIFERQYGQNPDEFNHAQKVDFAWTIIKVKMINSKDKNEFLNAADFITEMLPQADLNVKRSCPYTSAVFKVLIFFKNNNDYIAMIPWLSRLNPDLLDEKPYRSHGRVQKPRKEKYYDWASKAYLEDYEFEKCIEVSKTALNTLKSFQDDGDTWLRWRIAKSLKELNQLAEALKYFKKVIEVKHDWYMYREIAEIYYRCNRPYDALDYLCPAVLSRESAKTKVNLYLLCYKVFKSFNQEMALKHAELYYLIKSENGYAVPYEIEKLDIDKTKLNRRQLEREIRNLWTQYKFKDRKLHHGTVIKFIENKNFGFIKSDTDEEIFFHKSQFKGDRVYIGQLVSFFIEESFDKSKNRKSINAVNVRGE